MKLFPKKSAANIPRRRLSQAVERTARATEVDLEQHYTFRRNRTLTGSSSDEVSSVNESGSDLKSSRTHVHHLTHTRRRIVSVLAGVLAVVVVLAGLIYEITAYPVVTMAGNTVSLDKPRYEEAINDYFGLYPFERFRLLLNEEQLSAYMRIAVPEVVTVRQEGFAGFSASQFELTMREPLASWILGDKQYFVDDQGVSFEKNYFEMPAVSVIDQSGVQDSAGTAVASTRFLAFVGRTVFAVQRQGLEVRRVIIPLGTIRGLDVELVGRPYPIKLSLDRPVGEQVEDLKRAAGYFDQHQITPKYVDVRVSGKAFYLP